MSPDLRISRLAGNAAGNPHCDHPYIEPPRSISEVYAETVAKETERKAQLVKRPLVNALYRQQVISLN